MGTVTFNQQGTRRCPFCSETIRLEAIKCRFCAEFLNTDQARALEAELEGNSNTSEDHVLFDGRPSLLGLVAAAIKGLFFIGLAILLVAWPVENTANKLLSLGLTSNERSLLGQYRLVAGAGIAVIVILLLLLKILKLKMTCYEVTPDRIEWSRGVFDRKVDNLDMFRVIDLTLRRSLLDCLLGIGTVKLMTTDKTDPEFTFEKMRHSRTHYDIIKKASLEADRRSSVVHLE